MIGGAALTDAARAAAREMLGDSEAKLKREAKGESEIAKAKGESRAERRVEESRRVERVASESRERQVSSSRPSAAR